MATHQIPHFEGEKFLALFCHGEVSISQKEVEKYNESSRDAL